MKSLIISSSVLIAALLLVRVLFRKTVSRRVQYALWGLVALRLLIPVELPGFSLSVLNAAPAAQAQVTASAAREVYVLPMDRSPASSYPAAAQTAPGGVVPTGDSMGYPVLSSDGKTVTKYAQKLTVAEVLSRIWYGGMAAMAAWFVISNLRFRRKLRKGRVPCGDVGSSRPVYLCGALPSPCLVGLFRPAIYLTPAAAADERAVRHVLAHEETHARHGDPLWSLVRCVCLTIYWFNPLVWAAAVCSRNDCELACDEGALARLGAGERIAYGETLLRLIPVRHSISNPLLSATTMTAGKKQLKDRITRIAENRRTVTAALLAVAVIAAVICAVTFTGAEGKRASSAQDATPLTAEELAYFNDTFFNGEEFNLHNQFLSSLYDVPEDIDLFELFYCGTGLPGSISDEERQNVLDAFYDGVDPDCDCTKNSVSDMDAALTENMGLKLADTNQIGLSNFGYYESYDAYYFYHGDTNYRGSVTITAGKRQGDLISLYYDDTFMANGAKVVTLRETKDGGYHFVSNRYDAAPAVSAAEVPDEESVLSVKLDELTPYAPEKVETEPFARQEWGELMDSLWYQGAGTEPDRSILVGQWPDGGIYACYRVEDNTAGEDIYHRFAQVCDARYTNDYVENPDWISIVPFTDLFGYDGFVLTSDGLSRYYFFGEDGQLQLLYSGKLDRLFTAGEDCTYALDDAGGAETPAMLIQKGGKLYRADLSELLTRLTPKGAYPQLDVSASNGVGLLRYSDTASEQLPLCTRRVCCDGEDLLFYYGDGKTYTGHLADDIDVPEAVLTAAQVKARAAYDRILENPDGYDDWALWDPDDWRITGLSLARTVDFSGVTVEIYTQSILFHTATPEKVVLAGGSYITEDGWIAQDGLPGETFILPFVVKGDERTLVTGALANDYGVDSDGFDSDLRSLLIDNGLISFTNLTGEELVHDFYIQGVPFLTRLGALTETELDDLCGRMEKAAAGDDDLDLEWNDALTTVSWRIASLNDVQKRAYERLHAYADGTVSADTSLSSDSDAALRQAVLSHFSAGDSGAFRTEAHEVLYTAASGGQATYYAAVYYAAYDGGGQVVQELFSPVAVTLEEQNGRFSPTSFWEPQDYTQYDSEVRGKFPAKAAEQLLANGETYSARLARQCDADAAARFGTTGTAQSPSDLNPAFSDAPIAAAGVLSGDFERTYETELSLLSAFHDNQSPPFFCRSVSEFDPCAVLTGYSVVSGNQVNTAYLLFRDGFLGTLPLPVNVDGTAADPGAASFEAEGQLVRYSVKTDSGVCWYTVDLASRTVSMQPES